MGLKLYMIYLSVKKMVRNTIDSFSVDLVLQVQQEGGLELGPQVPVVFSGG